MSSTSLYNDVPGARMCIREQTSLTSLEERYDLDGRSGPGPVPATSANLGPGFDALGLALTLHDVVEARIFRPGLSIEIAGQGADLAGAGEEHLVVRAMRATFGLTGGQPPGIGLRCVNRIPHGRGLGSSAAAIVAGILAARALSEGGPAARPPRRCPPPPCSGWPPKSRAIRTTWRPAWAAG